MNIRTALKNVPVLGPIARLLYRKLILTTPSFTDSASYWTQRYCVGGTSGPGSYNELAEFKAGVLNKFVASNAVSTVIEYGCGDGNQLRLTRYPQYLGFDISPHAVARSRRQFAHDGSKSFRLIQDYAGERAELTLSLDVVYHLVEDSVFASYMHRLFDSSDRFVIIYSSSTDENPPGTPAHIRHRDFKDWISWNKKEWVLKAHVPNKYPFRGDANTGSFADFYIYARPH